MRPGRGDTVARATSACHVKNVAFGADIGPIAWARNAVGGRVDDWHIRIDRTSLHRDARAGAAACEGLVEPAAHGRRRPPRSWRALETWGPAVAHPPRTSPSPSRPTASDVQRARPDQPTRPPNGPAPAATTGRRRRDGDGDGDDRIFATAADGTTLGSVDVATGEVTLEIADPSGTIAAQLRAARRVLRTD